MRKFFVIPVVLLLSLGLVVAATASTSSNTTIVSQPGIVAYGPLDHYAPPSSPDWGAPATAVATWVHPSWAALVSIPDATWISTSYYTEDPKVDSWRMFRAEMVVACTALSITNGHLYVTSDNAEETYFNGELLGVDGIVDGPADQGYWWSSIMDYPINPVPGTNTFEFVVRNYIPRANLIPRATPQSNPTGLIYRATVDYTLPEVVPGTAFGGRLSFQLSDGSAVLTGLTQGFSLTVTDSSGNTVGTWDATALGFDASTGTFSVQFPILSGVIYTATVKDNCTGETLGAFEFTGSAGGTGTVGYWKNHPQAWPVDTIVIGGVTYTRDEAIAIMKTSNSRDATYKMFKQLVAAKLNVYIGNDSSCIADTIAAADAWMATYGPVGSGVKTNKPAWQNEGAALHEALDAYNNGLLCAPHR